MVENSITTRRERRSSIGRALVVFCGVVVLVYTAVWWPVPKIDLRLILLAIVTVAVSSRFSVKIPFANTHVTISDTFIFLALLVYGPFAGVWLAAVEGFISGMRSAKRLLTIVFNSSMMLCSTFVTVVIVEVNFGSIAEVRKLQWRSFIAATVVMSLSQYIANTGISAFGLSLKQGGPFLRTWYKNYVWTSLPFIVGGAVAAALSGSFEKSGVAVLLIAAPVIALVYITYHRYLNEVRAAAEQAERAERERAEAAERHVQELNQITENIRQVIWIQSSRDNRILYINPYFETLYALTREELQMNPECYFRVVDEQDLPALRAIIARRGTEPTDIQFRIHPRLGETRWIHSRTVPLDGDQILGAAQDVTEHKNMEIALRDSEQLYRDLFDNANDIVYTTDLNGRYTSLNKRGREITGYSEEEVGSLEFSDIASPEDVARGREMLRRKVELGTSDSTIYEIELKTKDGTRVPIEVSTQLVFKEGKPIGVQGIARDISERKGAEEALRKSEAQYRQLFESNPQPTYVVDDDTFRILATNSAAHRHYGYTSEEFKNLSLPEIWARFSPGVYRSLEAEREVRAVFQHVTKAGEFIDVQIVSRPIEFQDRRARLLLVKDVTADRRAEAERRAREAADESARVKSEFLANMSHEIRTPMNGILGMTELALQTELNERQRNYLEIVQSSSLSLLTIINDILDFSKIEAGKLTLEEIPFNLEHLVAELTHALALPAHQKGLELAWQMSAGIPAELIGDPVRLRQILTNLVGNAIKFTEEGEVIVRIRQIGTQNGHVAVDFAISDTGIGIPRDKQEVIFRSFAQADGSTTRKYGGTGLGLAISAQLVELMGGKLAVESDENKGSTFEFTVNLRREDGEYAAAASESLRKFENLDVLVVDDNSTNRTILEEALSYWQMTATVVSSGPEAITSVQRAGQEGRPFSIILLDACMPELDGFEVARRLKAHEIASATIMMLPSIDQHRNVSRLRELGIAEFLVKPISPAELYRAIQKLIDPAAVVAELPAVKIPEQLAPRKLLLVEDHLINQKVAVWTLESEGHAITAVDNGRQALDALKENEFDAILMDVQMPGMNGLEVTEIIRKQEKGTGRHIPIIAMTALAMKGDRKRCIDAGMDDYISKPIRPDELFTALKRVLENPLARPAFAAEEISDVVRVEPAPLVGLNGHKRFDRSEFLERINHKIELAVRLVNIFLQGTPAMMSEIEQALRDRDADRLYRTAHTLKTSVATLGAERARTLALELETMGRTNETANAEEVFGILENEIALLYEDLKAEFLPTAG